MDAHIFTSLSTNDLFQVKHFEKKQLIAAACIGVLILIPISLMVPMYLDDFYRSVNGKFMWIKDGRPLAELIYKVFVFDSRNLVLTSPLSTILCIPGICFSSLLLCRIFRNKLIWGAIFSSIFLFAQPYFLSNLSFSFDSPMMVLAIFFSICSAYLIVSYRSRLSLFFSIFLQVLSLSLYQAAISATWIPVLLYVFARPVPINTNKGNIKHSNIPLNILKQPHKYIIYSLVISQIFSLMAYKFIVLNSIKFGSYSDYHSTIPIITQLPFTLMSNISEYIYRLYLDWNDSSFGIIFLIFLLITSFYAIIKSNSPIYFYGSAHSSLRNKSLMYALQSLGIVSVFLISYGLPLILENPVFQPRTFIGIGVFMACISLLATRDIDLKIKPQLPFIDFKIINNFFILLLSVCAAWACIFSLFAYSNASASQQKLDNHILDSIVSEFRDAGYANTDITNVDVRGHSIYSPITLNTFRTLPYLRSFIRPITDHWEGFESKNELLHYGFTPKLSHDKLFINQLPAQSISSNKLYNLSVITNPDGQSATLIIDFNGDSKIPYRNHRYF